MLAQLAKQPPITAKKQPTVTLAADACSATLSAVVMVPFTMVPLMMLMGRKMKWGLWRPVDLFECTEGAYVRQKRYGLHERNMQSC